MTTRTRHRDTSRWVLAIAALCLVAVVATGCLKVDLDATVRSDDTVDGTLTAAVRTEAAQVLGAEQTEDFINTLTGNMPGTDRIEPYEDENFTGETVYFSDVALEDFGTEGSPDESELNIRHVRDHYVLTGQWNLPYPAGADALGDVDDSIVDSASFTVRITFPGKVVEHNGELNGHTVAWNLELGENHELFAEAQESTVGQVALIVLAICLVVILLAAIMIAVRLRQFSVGRQR